jgi:hypothetical protein
VDADKTIKSAFALFSEPGVGNRSPTNRSITIQIR